MKFILSIAIPIYNTEKYIEKCLDSLDINNNTNVEFILINDGSTDDSEKNIRKYIKNNVVYISKENEGWGPTITLAIKLARGKYFKILDSDDWFKSDAFSNLISTLGKIDSDCVFTNYSTHIQDGFTNIFGHAINNLGEHVTALPNLLEYNREYQLEDILKKYNFNCIFLMPSITFKSEIIKNMNLTLPSKIFMTDNIYCYFPILNINTVYFIDEDVYQYFMGRPDQSCSTKNFEKNIKGKLILAECFLNFFYENIHNKKSLTHQQLCYNFSDWARNDILLLDRNNYDAIEEIKKMEINKNIFRHRYQWILFKLTISSNLISKIYLWLICILKNTKK